MSSQSYQDQWRKLFEDHITWTRTVIMGVLDDFPRAEVFRAVPGADLVTGRGEVPEHEVVFGEFGDEPRLKPAIVLHAISEAAAQNADVVARFEFERLVRGWAGRLSRCKA